MGKKKNGKTERIAQVKENLGFNNLVTLDLETAFSSRW